MRSIREITENIKSGASSAHAFIIEGRPRRARDAVIDGLLSELGCHALDVVRMQMSGKTQYKTEDASAFTERLEMGAYGSVLAGVVDDADALSVTVQNKLLKTLEEPQDSVLIFLGTSNRDRLLDTVRSRCSVIRVQDLAEGQAAADFEEDAALIKEAAALMTDGSGFSSFREAADKCVKSKSDALLLVDMLEDGLRERMLGGESPESLAVCIETAERARMDIERDMDKGKALKRLFLELQGI